MRERKDVGKAIATEDEQKLIEAAKRSRSPALLPLFVLSLDSGLRANEIPRASLATRPGSTPRGRRTRRPQAARAALRVEGESAMIARLSTEGPLAILYPRALFPTGSPLKSAVSLPRAFV